MISTYKHNNITWIDLENPTQDEVKKLAEKYGLNPEVAHDLLTPSSKPIVSDHSGYIYLILHFPITTEKENYGKATEIQEVDFILGKDFIITTRFAAVDSLMEFTKTFTVNSVLHKRNTETHAGHIFFSMVGGLYNEMSNRLNYVGDLLHDAEDKIFRGKEKEMVVELSKLNRLLLHFNKALSIHEEVLHELIEASQEIYGPDFTRELRYILSEYVKVKSTIENLKDYSNELRRTNDSLLTTKQNEIMKVLTIMAFVTFPLSLLTGIFGMNTLYTPLIGLENDFWFIMAGMILLTISMFIYFKFKKWI